MNPTSGIAWTIHDLELLPEDGKTYEILAGELFVTRAPHWKHQETTGNIYAQLQAWSRESELGRAAIAPGIIFSTTDSVIPDVVWASQQRLTDDLDESGHLTNAPELVVEVLSKSKKDRQRDLELKLKLYSSQGVLEYWICDYQKLEIQVYRREAAVLKRVTTLFLQDTLTSPILPNFCCPVQAIFS
ncbi:MAG: Uma2 family endonuclease [Jaaginema sp. PMC 1079.18]|nr:Uma2 family endonuclease [Jaaginema sp. PMC 1080.18]MEC4853115.1 Uma2 family endonuclease [Jaaginema sp. PMC 1079.18]MEC4867949.1 Uma2 family endonuclease [Jaaginema sp. PMC 1078.18]